MLMTKNDKNIYFNVLLFSFFISAINYNVGFTIKPYMVVTLIGLIKYRASVFKINSMNPLEKKGALLCMIMFGSVVFATNFESSVRHIALLRSEEHTSELQSRPHLVCRLLL